MRGSCKDREIPFEYSEDLCISLLQLKPWIFKLYIFMILFNNNVKDTSLVDFYFWSYFGHDSLTELVVKTA